MMLEDFSSGYVIWLSSGDTRRWAKRPGNSWPCSVLKGRRLCVQVDANGIVDIRIDGRTPKFDVPGEELEAIIADHLPAKCRHFWPCWEQSHPA